MELAEFKHAWWSVFILINIQIYSCLAKDFHVPMDGMLSGNLEKFNLANHFRQYGASGSPNEPCKVRAITCSNNFNKKIVEVSAEIVRENKIPKSEAACFLSSFDGADKFCQVELEQKECAPRDVICNCSYPYRSIDGSCNNLQRPLLGAAQRPFNRLLPADYEDGVTLPRGFNRSPNPLPNPRDISNAMVSNPRPGTIDASLQLMQWGQFIDHDLILTPQSADINPKSGTVVPLACCERNDQSAGSNNPECLPINVQGDFFYSTVGVDCLRFVRSLPTTRSCKFGPREQMNLLTNFLDASHIYGSCKEEVGFLRTFKEGLLFTNKNQEMKACPGSKPFQNLPTFLNQATGLNLFFAGDERVLVQPGLTSMHTLFLRVHNKLANLFLSKYPSMSDEDIYQETRRIVGALVQSITYDEFLPIVLGNQIMAVNDLDLLSSGSTNNYDVNVDPTTFNEFGIAFRFGHSLISDIFYLKNKKVWLSESFNNNDLTQQVDTEPSDFLEGISLNPAELQDHVLVESVTNKLFAEGPSFTDGLDLYSLNIMRGRDHGIPPYNEWRKYCRLPTVNSFKELIKAKIMSEEAVNALTSVYSSVDDLDLYPAGLSELPDGNGILGPTLSCIISKHFRNIKIGDRFWFENDQQPKPFKPDQLKQIKQTKLSSLICRFTTASAIQPKVMLSHTLPGNDPVDCSSLNIPLLDDFNSVW